MKKSKKEKKSWWIGNGAAVLAVLVMVSCSTKPDSPQNLIENEQETRGLVNLFGPMEKSNPNAENLARTAFDMTIVAAEEKLNLTVEYRTYTAENYQEKTYDDVALDRIRNDMDDLYLLNPDSIHILGLEGRLLDLSGLENTKNLRDVVRIANTIDGKLVAVPQEIVANGLFVNQDMFDQYNLQLPNTPEEFLECCRVFKENGIETPVGANRWWLENFVFAQAYAELYNGDTTEEEILALNRGEAKYSDYMRPGFMFLQEMIDKGYVDAEKAYTYEAIEGEGPDFLAQKTPIVAITGYGISVNAEHKEDTIKLLNDIISDESLKLYSETNKVISPSKNVEVDCIPALKPLNDRISENIFVLGSNAGMRLEQWGNTCLLVRDLLAGATVDECMEKLDRLQEETLEK